MQVSRLQFYLGTLILGLSLFAPETEAIAAEVTEIIGVVRLGVSVVEYMYNVFAQIAKDPNVQDIDILGKGKRDLDKELLDEYYLISIALDRLAESNIGVETTIRQLQHNLPQIIRREFKLDRIDSIVRALSSSYKTFEYYQEYADQINSLTLQDFATSATSHGLGSIRFHLNELHSLVVPKGGILGDVGIFDLLSNGVEGHQYICFHGTVASPADLQFITSYCTGRNQRLCHDPNSAI
ncbi:uncharacterized protein LOC131881513 isoform X2 [Tigriopus californicus]|nr:uncharacterized protein LOC131881513 isoform X2 [Tigriopus californicus]